ncbi:MAG TPA: glycosyltransferase family 2 protein [Pirellulales bacterium]|jgi:dolichol-phosphate mannosyltransferase|nr:glycosyltransferase family 2 protein [Pirellulales bacterium]
MLSVVIPILNEAESLAALHRELEATIAAQHYEAEIIFIDDGSSDGSWNVIRELAAADPRVRGIRFRRRFGKAAALSAGFHAAQGETFVTLDADLQDDPAEIPKLLAKMDEGCDVVSGWKQVRHDPAHKVFASRVFNWLVSRLTGVQLHDHNCGLKSCRREVFDEVRLYGELHRFLPVLAAARGFRVGEVVVQHRPRRFGRSKYRAGRYIKGFLDLLTVKFLTGFGQRPQHLLGVAGLLFVLLGLVGLAYLAVYWILTQLHPDWHWPPLHERPALLYSLGALLFGGQMMSIGFLAELITSYYGRDTDTYSIAERLNNTAENRETRKNPPATSDTGNGERHAPDLTSSSARQRTGSDQLN